VVRKIGFTCKSEVQQQTLSLRTPHQFSDHDDGECHDLHTGLPSGGMPCTGRRFDA
jgi:hypothetical protein